MIPTYSEFHGKTAVITGGGGILCSHMAETLAAQGAGVAILDLHLENAEKVADKIRAGGGRALAIKTDVLSGESLAESRMKVMEAFGTCDILVNGAGGNHPKGTTGRTIHQQDQEGLTSFFDLDPEGIQFVFNLNFLGTLMPIQVFAADMIDKGGAIINISSMNAFRPLTRIPAYSGAKAAVSNFTQWLAVHFAKSNIRVNALAPGFFLTHQNHALLMKPDDTLTDRGKTILEHTPQGRFGKPEDLDGALLWLCSESSSFVTGITLPIDGGFSAFSGV